MGEIIAVVVVLVLAGFFAFRHLRSVFSAKSDQCGGACSGCINSTSSGGCKYDSSLGSSGVDSSSLEKEKDKEKENLDE